MGDYPDYTTAMQIIGSDIMLPIDIQAAYIQMPVDIQAQYITLDIDITAQTVGNIAINLAASAITLDINIKTSAITLNVDITAQTIGNIAVNLAASAITLDINIKTSAITLNVDITAQTIGNIAVSIASVTGGVSIDIGSVTGEVDIDINAQHIGVYLQPEWAVKLGIDKSIGFLGVSVASWVGTYADYTVTAGKTLYFTHLAGLLIGDALADRDKMQIIEMSIRDETIPEVYAPIGGNGGVSTTFPSPIAIPGGHVARISAINRSGHDCFISGEAFGYEV